MTEIISIFLSIIVLLMIFSFPLPLTSINRIKSINIYDVLLVNIVIHSNVFLILSFFPLNTNFIFFIYIILSICFFILFRKINFIYLKYNFLAIFFFIISLYCIFINIAQSSILSWDGAAHWLYKAQNFFQETEYKNLINLPFNNYPHLGSYIWAFFWKNSLIQIEYFGRFFFVFLLLSCCFSLGQQLDEKFSNFEKILISLLFTYLSTNFFLLGGYQEYFLFFIFFVFGRFFLLYQSNPKFMKKKYLIILILLTLNLFLWTKQEGFFYFIILTAVFLFHIKSHLHYKFLYFCFSLFLVFVFAKIKIFFFGNVTFNENVNINELFKNLFLLITEYLFNYSFYEIFYKILVITKYVLISFIKYPIWITIILSTAILIVKYKFFKNNFFFISYFFLHLALIYLVYFKHNDINTLIPLTLSRLIFPISGLYIFLIVILLNKLKR
jgi:hypothetical protein